MLFRTIALAMSIPAAAIALAGTASADGMLRAKGGYAAPYAATSTAVFSGYDIAEDAFSSYGGFVTALNRDLGKDGFLVRGVGVYVSYEYGTLGPGAVPRTIDGDAIIADVMLGYQFLSPGLRVAMFIGGEYQDHDLDPNDTANRVRGSEGGFKVAGELGTDRSTPLYLNVLGTYSTAFDSYWARGRIGWQKGGFAIGPEGGVSGNESYDAQRVGGFLKFDLPLFSRTTEVSLSAGYQFLSDNGGGSASGGEGAYGTIGFGFSF